MTAGRDGHVHAAFHGGYSYFIAQYGLFRTQDNFGFQILPLDLEIRVRQQSDLEIKITGGASSQSLSALTFQADGAAFVDAGGDFDLQVLILRQTAGAAAATAKSASLHALALTVRTNLSG